MTGKQLGKIKSAHFGTDGDGHFGLFLNLGGGEGSAWGCGDFWGCYPKSVNVEFGKIALRILGLLTEAKKQDVKSLAGVPIEAEFDGNTLKSWRVLTEVI